MSGSWFRRGRDARPDAGRHTGSVGGGCVSKGPVSAGIEIALRLLLALALTLSWGILDAAAQSPLPEVHSSCASEPTRASTAGDVVAQLTVINNTDATFELFWLDYEGERVYYQDSPPHSTVVQPTWLTHPWILADSQGTCYLLVVVNAIQQTMTIGSTTAPQATATPTAAASRTPMPEPSAAAAPAPVSTPEEADPPPGFPTPLVIAALVMMGVLVGVLAVSGKLFGRRGRPGP